jgi:hypothetical protein
MNQTKKQTIKNESNKETKKKSRKEKKENKERRKKTYQLLPLTNSLSLSLLLSMKNYDTVAELV